MDSNFFRPKIIVPKLYLKLEFDTEDQVLFIVVVFVVAIIVGHKNLTLKFGQKWVNDKWSIVVVICIVLVLLLSIQKSCFKLGPIQFINRWELLLLLYVIILNSSFTQPCSCSSSQELVLWEHNLGSPGPQYRFSGNTILVLREHNLADLRKITYNGSISVSDLTF